MSFNEEPQDLLAEGRRASQLWIDNTTELLDAQRMVSDAVLAHVLFALWDSGFYEYSRTHADFDLAEIASDLDLDPEVLAPLLAHLVGNGLLKRRGEGRLSLSERGRVLTNISTRGALDLYLGGYGMLLNQLSPLLRKRIDPSAPQLRRSGRHTAQGTEEFNSAVLNPTVALALQKRSLETVLDLGCGAAGFLLGLMRQNAQLVGVGVDCSASALGRGREHAQALGLDDRLHLVHAELGSGPLPVEPALLERVDAVTSMFMLHEFGRDGDEGIARVLRALRRQLPGRTLVVVEAEPAIGPEGPAPDPPRSQLDYQLIHPLSGQGSPRSRARWEQLFTECDIQTEEVLTVSWVRIYMTKIGRP